MKLPFTKRKKLIAEKLKYAKLVENLGIPHFPELRAIKEPMHSSKDLCLFVSHNYEFQIKPSVRFHIESLINEGVEVILIMNVDKFDHVQVYQDEFINNLSGLYIRENFGLDFGAWSDVYSHLSDKLIADRLWLVNDSICGPIHLNNFKKLVLKIKESSVDFLGLTLNTEPHPHLQSYFLVIKKAVFETEKFNRYFKNIHSFSAKQSVIDAYEVHMTKFIQSLGFEFGVIFSMNLKNEDRANDTIERWYELIQMGFPYIKYEALKNTPDIDLARFSDLSSLEQIGLSSPNTTK